MASVISVPDEQAVAEELRAASARFAFVHGSRAGEEPLRPDSDLDVAAWWQDEPPQPGGLNCRRVSTWLCLTAHRYGLRGVSRFTAGCCSTTTRREGWRGRRMPAESGWTSARVYGRANMSSEQR
jgi:hypothetical protein